MTSLKNEDLLNYLTNQIVKNSEVIQQVGEQEVDWEDEENSAYLKYLKLGQTVLKSHVYKSLKKGTSEVKAVGFTSKPKMIKIPLAWSGHQAISDALEEKLNSSRDREERKCLPSHKTVLNTIVEVGKEQSLNIEPQLIAERILRKLNRKVKTHRTREYLGRYMPKTGKDPAISSPELTQQLEANKTVGKTAEVHVAELKCLKRPESTKEDSEIESDDDEDMSQGDDVDDNEEDEDESEAEEDQENDDQEEEDEDEGDIDDQNDINDECEDVEILNGS